VKAKVAKATAPTHDAKLGGVESRKAARTEGAGQQGQVTAGLAEALLEKTGKTEKTMAE
jgi:hypothetical protein